MDNHILQISKSRKNILDILETSLNYNVEDYKNFNINEIDAMYSNEQLDMLIEHNENKKKVYIKYFVGGKKMISKIVDKYIEDLYELETILTPKDTLIIISQDEPNDTIINHIKHIYMSKDIFIVINTLKRLQFNVTGINLVPKMTILEETEESDLIKTYNLKSKKQLPEISRFDPQAIAMLMRPGNIGKIERNSVTSLTYDYYRICV
tara:strand:- start:265 stop:888 length:624 start_codon:yes stop_codon:yes gene_type:complete